MLELLPVWRWPTAQSPQGGLLWRTPVNQSVNYFDRTSFMRIVYHTDVAVSDEKPTLWLLRDLLATNHRPRLGSRTSHVRGSEGEGFWGRPL